MGDARYHPRPPSTAVVPLRESWLRFLRVSIAVGLLLVAAPARAQTEPSGHEDDAFDFMNLLAKHDLHSLQEERWNAYGQYTYISSQKLAFSAPYTNLNGSTNSLLPSSEHSFTGSLTLYLGLKTWKGGEIYLVPEVIAEKPLSHLAGLGGVIQNFELQKTGSASPHLYRSRLYFQQTIGFGGKREDMTSDPSQLAKAVDARRIVFTVGNFSVIDFLDKNEFSGDLRRQFFNMAFMTYAAYDFAADARGYAWGGVEEIYVDDWAFRIARVTAPRDPNQLEIDPRIYKYYGDQIEARRSYALFGQEGAVRVLGYRNRENMGRFDEAIAAFTADPAKNARACTSFSYNSGNATAPDLCWVRRPNIKVGIGVNVEQSVSDDVGLFFRGMVSDGRTEVYSYTSTDRSISTGGLVKGSFWHRHADTLGLGYGQGWISKEHASYLAMGGVDGFLGDGKLNQASEHVFETFYSLNVSSSLWISGDYQHIWNPGYNADRGPVDIFGARMHAEF